MADSAARQIGVLEKAEHYIYMTAGYILVIAAAGLLAMAVVEMVKLLLNGHFTEAIIQLLDRVLLALMLAEIIYTLGQIARTQKLQVAPFLIVGVIAAIRRMLIITAGSAGHVNLTDPGFQAVLVELGLLAVIIFLLTGAMRLLHGCED